MLGMVLALLVPVLPAKAQVVSGGSGAGGPIQNAEQRSSFSLPPFPEDLNQPAFTWANVDWESEVILPSDAQDYQRQVDKLTAQNRAAEVSQLVLAKRKMSDAQVLDYYQVPADVRQAVGDYLVAVKGGSSIKRQQEKDLLHQKLIVLGYGGQSGEAADSQPQSSVSSPEDEQYIDLATAQPLTVKELKPVAVPSADSVSVKVVKPRQAQASEPANGKAKILSVPTSSPLNGQPSPLIEYYDNIENNNFDYILYYLSQNQNQDGSFGSSNKYELTADIVLLLSEFNRQLSGQFNLALNYLLQTEPRNNREKAIKALILSANGEDPSALLDDLAGQQNNDGGFGYENSYSSDVLTTERVLAAFWQADYSLQEKLPKALLYVTKRIRDDGSIAFGDNSVASYYLVNKTLDALKPFQNMTIMDGNTPILIQDKINVMLEWLGNNFDSESGQLLNTADAIDALATLHSFNLYGAQTDKQASLRSQAKAEQNADGSFGNTLYTTLAAMQALAGPDLAVSNLQSAGNLVNKQAASFTLTITNQGQTQATNMVLYEYVDNYFFNRLDLASVGLTSLPPGGQTNLTFNNNDTNSFVGDTNVKFYLESANEQDYDNNWVDKNFTFASAADGLPGLPTYYIAQKYDIAGIPAVNVRWAKKDDSLRLNYVIMVRPVGESNWTFIGIRDDWNGAYLAPFTEDATYEVTAGVLALDEDTVVYFSDYTTIKMSADPAKYNGYAQGFVTDNEKPIANLSLFAYGYGFANIDANGLFALSKNEMGNGSGAAWVDSPGYEPLVTKFSVPLNATTTDVRLFTRLKADQEPPQIQIVQVANEYDYRFKNQREVYLVATGNDNVAIKEADFWYWDPAEESWIFIGVAAVAGGQGQMLWYVPAGLVGGGYKIRATLTDYQGNVSLPLEWGPFEILDGTAPTGTVTVQGLTNGQWSLGEEKTISWQIDTPVPLATITSIILWLKNNGSTIAYNVDPSQTSVSYVMPLNAYYATSSAFVRLTACNINYVCAAFDSSPFAIIDNTPPPHYPWGVEQEFTGMGAVSGPGIQRYLQQAFHNSDGSREIIYQEEADGYRRIKYRRLVGDTWQDPITLTEHLYNYPEQYIAYDDIQAVKAPNGDIHIIYGAETVDGLAGLDSTDIYYLHISNGQVVSNRRISAPDGTRSFLAKVAVNDSGRVFIVWIEGYSYINRAGVMFLHYIEGNGLDSWTGDLTMTDDWSNSPTIALVQNLPVIMYSYHDQLNLRRQTGTGWLAPVIINKSYIERTDLDQFSADADKLAYIVAPLDEKYYQWLPSIRAKSDLQAILNAQQFASRDQIMEVWRQNEYSYGAYFANLFAEGENTYEYFYIQGSEKTSWRYDLRHLRLGIDFANLSRVVYDDQPLADRPPEDNIFSYAVRQDKNNNYHFIYTKRTVSGDDYSYHPYYLFYDGEKTYFSAVIASLLRYVDYVTTMSEQNGFVTAYFSNLYNSADYAPIANYRLNNISPENKAPVRGTSVKLRWVLNGGPADSYQVALSTQPLALETVATELQQPQYTAAGLLPNKTYYWQVKAIAGDSQIYSNVWQFTTASNNSPIANIAQASGNEDTPFLITLTGSDADLDPLTFSIVSGPAAGQLGSSTPVSATSSQILYTPDTNYFGQDSFTFKANDGMDDSAPATAYLTINPVNDPPQAQDNIISLDEDATSTVAVLANDHDIDLDILSISSFSQGQHGTVAGSGPALIYAPSPNYSGQDSFTYSITDGHGGTAQATVNITVNPVNDPPLAVNDSAETNQNQAVSIAVLANDSDPEGDPVSISGFSQPTHGSVSQNNSQLVYTPSSGFHGQDSFTYTIMDSNQASATAEVDITVVGFTTYSISGRVKYYDGVKPVPGARVILEDSEGSQLDSVATDGSGNYRFANVAVVGNYRVRVEKEDAFAAVNILDIVKTVRHISMRERFNSIYKIIAADANRDGIIVLTDVTKMVRYILGMERFPSGDWKFFNSDFALNESNYLSEGQIRQYAGLSADLTSQDFIGLRMGDVNNSWR